MLYIKTGENICVSMGRELREIEREKGRHQENYLIFNFS